jgi:crotonobetainyl-CoA:carnitine CoA-transferase CaiB-like acyl-CoA transferase
LEYDLSGLTKQHLNDLLARCSLSADDHQVSIELDGEVADCRFSFAEAAAVALAAFSTGVAEIWRDRGGRPQVISVSSRHAAASLISIRSQRLNGRPPFSFLDQDGHSITTLAVGGFPPPYFSFHRTRDDRWFWIHGIIPHLVRGTMKVLGLREPAGYPEVAKAVATFNATDLEEAMAEARMCGVIARTAEEWANHPQGQACARDGCISIEKIGDSEPEPFTPVSTQPLDGLSVLDLTRILAAPTAAKLLAGHGADVLHISSPNLYSGLSNVLDTGHGKRSASLDLDRAEDAATLRKLIADADVFCQSYRNGAMERRGLSPQDVARVRPGIVYLSVNCYGHAGPWFDRPGFDPLACAATGISLAQGEGGPPETVPVFASDYVTGSLGALGVISALRRRAREGGSYHVKVSLTQSATWMYDFAPLRPRLAASEQANDEQYFEEMETPFGRLRYVRPVPRMSITAPRWKDPVVPLGTHEPIWRNSQVKFSRTHT